MDALERQQIHGALAAQIDDELETIFKTVTGKDPAYAVVFEWVGNSFNDETASQKLLGVALRRGIIDQDSFNRLVLVPSRLDDSRWLARSRRANKSGAWPDEFELG